MVINGKFHVCARNLVQVCNILIPTKSILESSLKRNRKSDIFNFFYDFCAVFAIFRPPTVLFGSSSNTVRVINAIVMLNYNDFEFLLKSVSLAV